MNRVEAFGFALLYSVGTILFGYFYAEPLAAGVNLTVPEMAALWTLLAATIIWIGEYNDR